jgi:Uma2 family endonuclease
MQLSEDFSVSVTVAIPRATLADLANVDGKAELIGGKVVPLMATGYRPGIVALRIARRLADHVDTLGRGVAFGDNIGFAVAELSTGRESFSPDAAYYSGPPPADDMKFVPGPPDFAAEVRSEGDYGPAAELALAEKRAEYFEAGTLIVWDVDPVARVVRSYRSGKAAPQTFGAGTQANAEAAVPGWSLSVDWLMA